MQENFTGCKILTLPKISPQIFMERSNYSWTNDKLQGNVDIDERLPNGWTALHRATEENKGQVTNEICLYWPVWIFVLKIYFLKISGYHLEPIWVKMMKTLIDYNASVDAKTDSGFTPLMLGVQSGNLEAIRLLVAHNADVNAQNGYQGKLENGNFTTP